MELHGYSNMRRHLQVMQLIVDGTIKLEPCKRFPLEQWQQAVEYSQKPGRGGKAMLEG